MRRGFTLVELAVVLVILLLLAGCMGLTFLLEIPFWLVFGWITYLKNTLPQIHFDWPNVAFAVGLASIFVLGAHAFLSWLQREVRGGAWPWKRTLGLTTAALFAFVAGLSLTGVAHQIAWQAAGEEPFLDGRSGARSVQRINETRQVVLGLYNYHDARGSLPPGTTVDNTGRPLHGWQTQTLPYIEQQAVYDQIDLARAWNDAANKTAMQTRIPAFQPQNARLKVAADERVAPAGFGVTQFAGNVHLLGGTQPTRFDELTDGAAQSILLGAIRDQAPAWGYPRNARDPALGLNRSPQGFGSDLSGGVPIGFADGSVLQLSEKTDPAVLKALATPRGGEAVSEDDYRYR